MATFEKNMAFAAHNGPSEMNGPAACKQIKAINPQVATVYYLNSVIDWPFYSLHDKMVANPSWRLKNKQGDDLRVVGQYGFNFSVRSTSVYVPRLALLCSASITKLLLAPMHACTNSILVCG